MYITAVNEKDPSITEIVLKWDKLVDNAKYLGTEYRYKEKEYGFLWRAAYKTYMKVEF